MNVQLLIKTCCFGLLLFGTNALLVAQEDAPQRKYRPLTMEEVQFLHAPRSKPQQVSTASKTATCKDTLRYPYQKQDLMGDINLGVGGFGLSRDTNLQVITINGDTVSSWLKSDERISQAFLNTGELTITGVEFISANDTWFGKPEGVTVRVSIYTVDAAFKPMESLGSGTVFITQPGYAYYTVNFTNPIVVSGNYAVMLDTPNHGEGCWIMGSDPEPNQAWDEIFCYWYAYISQEWKTIPDHFLGDEWEVYVAPIVEYSLTASADFTPVNPKIGDQVALTSTTDEAFLSNRMFTMQALRNWFGLTTFDENDSTFVWNLADDETNPTTFLSRNATRVYEDSNKHTPILTVNGGFSNQCSDATTILVQPTPKVGINTTTINSILIFPNPTIDMLHIEGFESERSLVELSDMQGNILLTVEVKESQLSLSIDNLSAGIYFVSVFSNEVNMHQKIVKQ